MARIALETRRRTNRPPTPLQWIAEWDALPAAERWRAGGECLICGARIRDLAAATHVHLLTSLELADRSEVVTEAEDQGYFPVGPECARRVPAAFRFPPEHVCTSSEKGAGHEDR